MDKTLWAVSLVFCGAASAADRLVVVPAPAEAPPRSYCSPEWPKLPSGGAALCGKREQEAAKPPPRSAPRPPPVQRPKELITV